MLPQVVAGFQERGLAVEAEGAVCVFLPGFTNREGGPLPLIIRKSDGGYNYETPTSRRCATASRKKKAQRVIYVTDIRQRQHFEMFFRGGARHRLGARRGAARSRRLPEWFSADRRAPSRRARGTVKLKDLLDEAVSRFPQA